MHQYGHPEKVMTLKEVSTPIPKSNEVLIKVNATSINDYDWGLVTGKPYLYRLIFGVRKPKFPIAGMEVAGSVAAVGDKVQKWKIGDEVFGDISGHGFGTFAQYVCVNENTVITKPPEMSFEQAAALPHASLLALQAMIHVGKLREGQEVLINGGGGGVGTIGIQLAKQYRCKVSGVDSQSKHALMQHLGCNHVIDYKKTNFTKINRQYDLILDCKSGQYPYAYLRALKKGGIYVSIGGEPKYLISLLLGGLWLTLLSFLFLNKKLKILALRPNEGLDEVCNLFKEKQIEPQIEGPYLLSDIPRLIQHFGEGRHQGKIIIGHLEKLKETFAKPNLK